MHSLKLTFILLCVIAVFTTQTFNVDQATQSFPNSEDSALLPTNTKVFAPTGESYVLSTVVGQVSLGSNMLIEGVPFGYAVLIKYDTNLQPIWTKTINADIVSRSAGLALSNSSVFVVGSFIGNYTTESGQAFGTNFTKCFIAEYNFDGEQLWFESFGDDPAIVLGSGASLDGEGSLYITGYFRDGDITFGEEVLSAGSTFAIFYAKLNTTSKEFLWSNITSSQSNWRSISIQVNSRGYGCSTGLVQVPFQMNNITVLRLFGFASLRSDQGELQWIEFILSDQVFPASCHVTDENEVIVMGYYGSIIVVGNLTVEQNSLPGGFFVKFREDGQVQTLKATQGGFTNFIFGSCIDSQSSCYITGSLQNTTRYDEQIISVPDSSSQTILWKTDMEGSLIDTFAASGQANIGLSVDAINVATGQDHVFVAGGFLSGPVSFDETIFNSTSNSTQSLYYAKFIHQNE